MHNCTCFVFRIENLTNETNETIGRPYKGEVNILHIGGGGGGGGGLEVVG